jgi:hypothetical protein
VRSFFQHENLFRANASRLHATTSGVRAVIRALELIMNFCPFDSRAGDHVRR